MKYFKFLILIVSMIFSSKLLAQTFQTGDIIFQTSKSAQSIVIQKATASPYSHMGMIVYRKGQPWVLEAIQPVKYTPFDAWKKRGVNQRYVVKSFHKKLNAEQQMRLVKSAEKHLGKNYDLYFGWGDDAIYCSEIVWKAYKEALGVELAPLQKLKQFDLTDPKVKALMSQRYGQNVPLNETVIAPRAIFESKLLLEVK